VLDLIQLRGEAGRRSLPDRDRAARKARARNDTTLKRARRKRRARAVEHDWPLTFASFEQALEGRWRFSGKGAILTSNVPEAWRHAGDAAPQL